MKFTLSWLKQHLETDASIDEIVKTMTLTGLEVEGVENPAEQLRPFTVAKIINAEKHPNADKLKICTVSTLDGEKTIVCGAPNAKTGMKVVYAPMGAYIPGADFELDKKPRNIRGIESSGMLCSSKEIGLDEDDIGIMDLDKSFTVGTPLAEALDLDDPVIDFEVTPNRPDWLGVDSIARELAAAGTGKLKTKSIESIKGKFSSDIQLKNNALNECPVIIGRVIKNVKNGPSPKWLQNQLKAIGLRPISALVDITNFIAFDRARPLHIYDADALSGNITVSLGKEVKFEALDEKCYHTNTEDVTICDDKNVLGLGGIIGGSSTSCNENTTNIFIECAYFDPLTIRKTAKRLSINTDAKYRFERGVDTGFLMEGLDLATQMVLNICGGEVSEIVQSGEIPAPPKIIEFNLSLVKSLTGLDISEDKVMQILSDLGFKVENNSVCSVQVPTWRRDVTEGADLVEEIVRIYGYHNIKPVKLPEFDRTLLHDNTIKQRNSIHSRRALANRGMNEAITWSFVKHSHAKLFDGGSDDLLLENPISNDLNCMRPTALIHLLLASQRNADKGFPNVALFESGPIYTGTEPQDQHQNLAGLRRVVPRRSWSGTKIVDVFTAKRDVLSALNSMNVKIDNLQSTQTTKSYWHPGRSSRLQMGPKNILADFGEIHPRILKEMGINCRIVAFEIWPDSIPPKKKNKSKSRQELSLSDLMPISRDFAFIVKESVDSKKIIQAARSADKGLISGVNLFDIYRGEGVEKGYKSIAIEIILSPKLATLTDNDIEAVSKKIITSVEKSGGFLRV
ncbi:MAG: phenylalanine--tRNA ligase subunit beta [Hellea sp.]|nr:phenylalanine--tRNA ligase subunit beta [Hellea sp.]